MEKNVDVRSRRWLLLIVLLVVASGGYALWKSLGGSANEQSRAVDSVRASRNDVAGASTLDAPDDAHDLERRSSYREDPSRSDPASDRSENFALDRAAWIEGSVQMPAGTPLDETLCVWAISALDESNALFIASLESSARVLNLIPNASWSRRAVDAQGAFRVPCPSDTHTAFLIVDGRYLFFGAPKAIAREELASPQMLEPELGAWLVVHCVPPAGANARESAVGARATIYGPPTTTSPRATGGKRFVQRELRVDANSALEVRGLPADTRYKVRVMPERLADIAMERIAVSAGRKTELELALAFGARVLGRVVDEQQVPVAGVHIRSSSSDDSQHHHRGFDETAADGTFELGGFEAGKYRLGAELEGWAHGESGELTLSDEQRLDGVEIVLRREALIRGTVVWPDGAAASRASVSAIDTGNKNSKVLFAGETRYAKPDESGKFTIHGLASGPFFVSAVARRPEFLDVDEREAASKPPSTARNVLWSAGQADVQPGANDLVLVLREPPGLSGRVADSEGKPLREFTVHAIPDATRQGVRPELSSYKQTFATDDGSFALDNVPEGDWFVAVMADAFVQPGQAPSVHVPGLGEPLVIRMLGKSSIRGRIVDPNGNPVAGAYAQRRKPGDTGRLSSHDEQVTAWSDAKGEFTLKDVPVGAWQVTAYSDAWATSGTSTLQLALGQSVNDLVLQMRLGGTLLGEVLERGGSHASGGDVQCVLVSTDEEHATRVDKLGAFRFEHLLPGAYKVAFIPERQHTANEGAAADQQSDMADVAASIKLASCEIREGEVTRVVIGAPSQASVKLSGRITQGGSPPAKCAVIAINEGREAYQSIKFGKVDGDGRYELMLDKPGDVVLMVSTSPDQSMDIELYVTVPAVSEYTFDVALPATRIRGTVRGPDGTPASTVPVQLMREAGGANLAKLTGPRSTTTDANGHYTFDSVTPGTYAVAAGGSSGPFAAESKLGRVVRGGLVLENGRMLDSVDLQLATSCSLSGFVRDADGKAVAGATVFVRDSRGECLARMSSCKSDERGEYTYAGLAPGSYTVSARAGARAARETASIAVREDASARMDLTLEAGTMLRVATSDKGDKAVRAGVSVTNEQGLEVGDLQTSEGFQELMADGWSTSDQKLGPLPPGKYVVTATTPSGKSTKQSVTLSGESELAIKLRVE